MKAIEDWLKSTNKDYHVGVALYATLPTKKTRTLKLLNRNKSRRNLSLLLSELRKYSNKPIKTQSKTITSTQLKPITQEVINTEAKQKQLINTSVKQKFGGILIGELPAELRPRYSRAYNLFIQLIELKFSLNELPASAEASALKIMIQIEQIDDERDLIWKELHHWKRHKTLLPTKTDDFSNLTALQLELKKRNATSSITKIGKRVDLLYNQLDQEKNPTQQRKIEDKINRSEKRIHQHQINISKIKELI